MGSDDELISASADDCDESNIGVVDTSDTQIVLSSLQWGAGLRFQNVGVPQGATIDNATLKLRGTDDCSAGGCYTDIYGVDADDASAWGSGNKPSSQTKTTASTAFDSTTTFIFDAAYKTWNKDVTDIVQEIVNRNGWKPNNSMSFVIEGDSFGRNKNINLRTYDNSSTTCSELIISWSLTLPNQINISDTWKSTSGMKINISDEWKDVVGSQVNIGDTWKTIF